MTSKKQKNDSPAEDNPILSMAQGLMNALHERSTVEPMAAETMRKLLGLSAEEVAELMNPAINDFACGAIFAPVMRLGEEIASVSDRHLIYSLEGQWALIELTEDRLAHCISTLLEQGEDSDEWRVVLFEMASEVLSVHESHKAARAELYRLTCNRVPPHVARAHEYLAQCLLDGGSSLETALSLVQALKEAGVPEAITVQRLNERLVGAL